MHQLYNADLLKQNDKTTNIHVQQLYVKPTVMEVRLSLHLKLTAVLFSLLPSFTSGYPEKGSDAFP